LGAPAESRRYRRVCRSAGSTLPVGAASDYEWAYRDQEKRLVRIAIPEMRDLPGMDSPPGSAPAWIITHDNPSPLVPPVTLSLFTNGNLGEAPETVSGQIDLEMVDVNQDLVRFMFHPRSGRRAFLSFADSAAEHDRFAAALARCLRWRFAYPPARQGENRRNRDLQILPATQTDGRGRLATSSEWNDPRLETALNLSVLRTRFRFRPRGTGRPSDGRHSTIGWRALGLRALLPARGFCRFDVTTNQPLAEDRLLSERPIVFTASFEPDDPEESSRTPRVRRCFRASR
jgi:hypothetical protein